MIEIEKIASLTKSNSSTVLEWPDNSAVTVLG